jgi:hypothetical protein
MPTRSSLGRSHQPMGPGLPTRTPAPRLARAPRLHNLLGRGTVARVTVTRGSSRLSAKYEWEERNCENVQALMFSPSYPKYLQTSLR